MNLNVELKYLHEINVLSLYALILILIHKMNNMLNKASLILSKIMHYALIDQSTMLV